MQKTSIIRAITLRSQGRAEARPLAMRAASLVILVAGAAGTANAQLMSEAYGNKRIENPCPIFSQAFGDQMVGGTVTIEWADWATGAVIGATSGPIVLGPGVREAIATIPGFYGDPGASFSVEDETYGADWELTHIEPSNLIISAAIINLRGTDSLFDDGLGGVVGGTPNGALGRAGVVYQPIPSTAPMEIGAFEFDPWGAACNVGDMYWQERIEWNTNSAAGPVFQPGLTYVFWDDTDSTIPAPGGIALLGFAAALIRRRSRA